MTTFKSNGNALVAEFIFSDFKSALAFINKVGELAELQQHHPHIENVYNKVTLKLYTHDAGNTITQKDELLAKAIEAII
jgi:4a-hydroxytetrahydrobiopterin dehydratase